eukprot:605758-Heterocapsa_arctica.AAC.1
MDCDLRKIIRIVLLDIQKAYPSVPGQAAFAVFSNLGIPHTLLNVIKTLHDKALFNIRTREGFSETYETGKGFREGEPSSPVLYNSYRSVATNDFCKPIAEDEATRGEGPGLEMGSLEGRAFNKRWTRHSKHQHEQGSPQEFFALLAMFADDTTLIARQKDQPEMEKLLVKVLRDWGEIVHPTKTQRIQAGGRDPGMLNASDENHCLKETKLLGSWLD